MEFIVNNWFQIATTIGIVIGWLVDRKIHKSSAKEKEADAMSRMQAVYDKFVEDVECKVSSLKAQIAELQEQLAEAKLERDGLLERLKIFEQQSKEDKTLIANLTEKVNRYEKEVKQYRKSLNS